MSGRLITAFGKEQRLSKERGEKVLSVIPLNLDGYLFDDGYEGGYRGQLRSRVAGDFVGWESDGKFESGAERLVEALRADAMGKGES